MSVENSIDGYTYGPFPSGEQDVEYMRNYEMLLQQLEIVNAEAYKNFKAHPAFVGAFKDLVYGKRVFSLKSVDIREVSKADNSSREYSILLNGNFSYPYTFSDENMNPCEGVVDSATSCEIKFMNDHEESYLVVSNFTGSRSIVDAKNVPPCFMSGSFRAYDKQGVEVSRIQYDVPGISNLGLKTASDLIGYYRATLPIATICRDYYVDIDMFKRNCNNPSLKACQNLSLTSMKRRKNSLNTYQNYDFLVDCLEETIVQGQYGVAARSGEQKLCYANPINDPKKLSDLKVIGSKALSDYYWDFTPYRTIEEAIEKTLTSGNIPKCSVCDVVAYSDGKVMH